MNVIAEAHTAHFLILKHSLHMDRSRGDVGEASMIREAVVVVVAGNIFRCSPRDTVAKCCKELKGKTGRDSEKLERAET
jgi:hypothetical protein